MSPLNMTTQRKAVYGIVQQSNDHPTAADVIERLHSNGYNFAYGTVYNSLRYLTNAGLIHELKLGETSSRYDGRIDEHQHIVCRRCGRVDEVFSVVPVGWVNTVANETNYTVDHSHVIFEGVCSACRTVK
jgi:Fur family peroxide stress response transcriptional regulator